MADAVWARDFENLPPIQDFNNPIQYRTPWLDFIRKWFKLSHEDNPFSQGRTIDENDPLRKLNVGQNTETYSVRDNENEEFTPVFMVYLNNAAGTARIELFDPKYVDQSNIFMKELNNVS